MPSDPTDSISASLVAAQERYQAEVEAARRARRKVFAKAHDKGRTLREIGEVVGLHHTRVGQIIRGE